MHNPVEDQIEAATKHTKEKIEKALGITHPTTPMSSTANNIVEEMLDRYYAPPNHRCKHLVFTPIQQSTWTTATGWTCDTCTEKAAKKRIKMGPNVPLLDPIEEFTCDRCRRYTGYYIKPVILRYFFLVMHLGCCKKCVQELDNAGAIMINTGTKKEQ